MRLYKILSVLLDYPQQDLRDALPDIDAALRDWPGPLATLTPLLAALATGTLIDIQEKYVATFDRTPSHSLHLFEHIHGESRDRGQAMVDLLDEYRRHGYDLASAELPDHVPVFLEFLSQLPAETSGPLLDEAIHVLAAIGDRLTQNGSPYSAVFTVLRSLARVEPLPQIEPPVRDMDEAMETFGVGADGVEPLLRPAMQAEHAVRFYPRNVIH